MPNKEVPIKVLDLQSEPYSATGNLASEGVLNQLGRPALDRLTVLVREAVQNSWDARIPTVKNISFGLSAWTMTAAQKKSLTNTVFATTPPKLGLGELLKSDKPIHGLAIWDRGTTGLGGPTRADVINEHNNEPDDFVDFLRNIGRPPDKKLSGGTFGYGKAAFYLASQVSTICVHTHCTYKGKPEQRFIVAALGPSYQHEKTNYTGRHWWGRKSGLIVEPLLGEEADAAAYSIGMPAFNKGQQGTTILLLQPHLDEKPLNEAMQAMIQALLWNFWPKMLAQEEDTPAPIQFEVRCEGTLVIIPAPSKYPPLQGFVAAMNQLKRYLRTKPQSTSPPEGIYRVSCDRPRKHLGVLSIVKFPFEKRANTNTSEETTRWPPEIRSHHAALMRQPELVVKYIAGYELPTDMLEYAGVFLTDVEVDPIFARAEPPTHDDWVHEGLENRLERSFVKVCLRNINENLKSFVSPPGLVSKAAEVVPLAAFAEKLGDLLLSVDGPGASRQVVSQPPEKNSKTTKKKKHQRPVARAGVQTGVTEEDPKDAKGRARLNLTPPQLELVGGKPTLGIEFEVVPARENSTTLVKVTTVAVLDGNKEEEDPPLDAVIPQVLQWVGPQGQRIAGKSELHILPEMVGKWKVSVLVPPDAVVQVKLQASSVVKP
jgi:hypothetical protein